MNHYHFDRSRKPLALIHIHLEILYVEWSKELQGLKGHFLCFFQSFNMTVVHQVPTTTYIDDLFTSFRFLVVWEMKHSSSSCKEFRGRSLFGLLHLESVTIKWCHWSLKSTILFLNLQIFFFLLSSFTQIFWCPHWLFWRGISSISSNSLCRFLSR